MATRKLSPARAAWKAAWRQLRIIRREAGKAATDMLLFGVGFVETGKDVPDFIRHVDPSDVVIRDGAPHIA